jgi:hypothetical protein
MPAKTTNDTNMTDSKRENASAPEGAEAKPLPDEEGDVDSGEELEQAARRDVRACLVKALLNTAHLYEQAAYKLGTR